MSEFSERLKELRAESGLSAMALGKSIGVSDMAILRWENGKSDITGENLKNLPSFLT